MLEVTQQILTSARGMCSTRFRFMLLCLTGVLSSSCEKSDSPVDAALAQSICGRGIAEQPAFSQLFVQVAMSKTA
jgi:hypothetical protein